MGLEISSTELTCLDNIHFVIIQPFKLGCLNYTADTIEPYNCIHNNLTTLKLRLIHFQYKLTAHQITTI